MSERGFEKMLDAIYCPICGSRLHIDESGGKRRLLCDRHGEMKAYLEKDPRAVEVAAHCDGVGVKDLEAP